ncbi:MAG: DUF6045 family protein [Lachnospiraceae bacterium]|nr:DUF6045 family protein [Lachnospiraceae bacterium]
MVSWFLEQILEYFSTKTTFFFAFLMDTMATEGLVLFDMPLISNMIAGVQTIGMGLWGVGMVMAVYDLAILYAKGRSGSYIDLGQNFFKSYLAAALFWALPVPAYRLMVEMGSAIAYAIPGGSDSIWAGMEESWMAITVMSSEILVTLVASVIFGVGTVLAYVQFLKRGFYLFILICSGCLYMVSIPRGYQDGFVDWIKQVAGLCFSSCLQVILMVFSFWLIPQGHMMLGIAGLYASKEIDRLMQRFGGAGGMQGGVQHILYAAHSMSLMIAKRP